MGAYHTIDLELNRPFTLTKDEWDIITLDRVNDACNIATKSDIAAIVLEQGLANVCLLTQNMTIVRQRIERNVPKKGRGTTTQHDKGLEKFFDDIYRSIQMHVNFEIVKVLIIASPGFVKVFEVKVELWVGPVLSIYERRSHRHRKQNLD